MIYLVLGGLCLLTYTNCSTSSSKNPGTGTDTPNAVGCFEQLGANTEWSQETEIQITGYTGNAMEPQISADGNVLLFNNKTSDDTQMDVHYAVKQNNGTYAYGGSLAGANNAGVLDGVPATDSSNNFYFVSLRNYGAGNPPRYRTLFGAQFSLNNGLSLVNVAAADNALPAGTAPSGSTLYVDMDLGVSWDGSTAIVARTKFSDNKGYPDYSRLELFDLNPSTRSVAINSNSSTLLANVNLDACRIYAPSMSTDKKELYYTVLEVTGGNVFNFKNVVAKRTNTTSPFGRGSIITAMTGQIQEGPSISYHDGGKTLYYHKQNPSTGKFSIFKVSRP